MARLFKGKKALLLAEGCKLNKEIKERNERLSEIKDELDITKPGTYRNEANDELVVSETEQFSDIAPQDVLAYLRKKKMGKRIWECVKVQLTPLRKVIPEDKIDEMRIKLRTTFRYSFK